MYRAFFCVCIVLLERLKNCLFGLSNILVYNIFIKQLPYRYKELMLQPSVIGHAQKLTTTTVVKCGRQVCIKTKQKFVIKLFDNSCDLKKSVMRTCLVDFWSICGKTVAGLLELSITGLIVDLGLCDVEVHIRKSCWFCGLQYALDTH